MTENKKNAIYIATYSEHNKGKIWCKEPEQDLELIAEGLDEINAMCNYNEKLIAATPKKIIKIDETKNKKNKIEHYNDLKGIVSLTEHKGYLYGIDRNDAYKISKGSDDKRLNLQRKNSLFRICSSGGILYDAAGEKIYNTLKDQQGTCPIVERCGGITALIDNYGALYDAYYIEPYEELEVCDRGMRVEKRKVQGFSVIKRSVEESILLISSDYFLSIACCLEGKFYYVIKGNRLIEICEGQDEKRSYELFPDRITAITKHQK